MIQNGNNKPMRLSEDHIFIYRGGTNTKMHQKSTKFKLKQSTNTYKSKHVICSLLNLYYIEKNVKLENFSENIDLNSL